MPGSEFFSVENFLHLDLSGAASFAIQPERTRDDHGKHFQLKNPGRAIVSEEDYRNVIHISRSATVVLVDGNIDEDPFVEIRYRGRVLLCLPKTFVAVENCWEDWRNGGKLVSSARK